MPLTLLTDQVFTFSEAKEGMAGKAIDDPDKTQITLKMDYYRAKGSKRIKKRWLKGLAMGYKAVQTLEWHLRWRGQTREIRGQETEFRSQMRESARGRNSGFRRRKQCPGGRGRASADFKDQFCRV
jgi:hypothetical protein